MENPSGMILISVLPNEQYSEDFGEEGMLGSTESPARVPRGLNFNNT
jgi:hypothetical protein